MKKRLLQLGFLARLGEWLVKKFSKKELYDPKKEAVYDTNIYSLYEKETFKPVKKDLTIHDLVREQMGLLTEVPNFSSWQENEKQAFYAACFNLNRNEHLNLIFAQLTQDQKNVTFKDGITGQDFIDAKISISGGLAVKDWIHKYALKHDTKEEEFDQYEAI